MKSRQVLMLRLWVPVAVTCSVLVLIMLHMEGLGLAGMLATLGAFVLWWVGAGLSARGYAAPGQADSRALRLAGVVEPARYGLEQFYARLIANVEYGWSRFQQDYQHALIALHNVDRSLEKALDIARSTGLLAANAVVNAAQTGEIGRGFVSVSRDMIGISEQSEADLALLKRKLDQYLTELARCRTLVEYPLDYWLVSSVGLPVVDLVNLRTETHRLQQALVTLADRYRRSGSADVRWLQLGDAVKRLLSELTNTLYQLELHLQDVLSDMRLLQLNPQMRQQIVEIKDRMQASGGREVATQKFIL
ncbi:MAG: hypothetical protein R3F47_05055 [Gammaproteobacteria bacterium]